MRDSMISVRGTRPAALALAVMLVVSARATGQRITTTLESGTLVRLHIVDSSMVVGRLLVPFGPDSTVFRYCRYPAPPCESSSSPQYDERALTQVLQIEVRTGTKAAQGALIGAGVYTATVGAAYLLARNIGPAARENAGSAATILGLTVSVGVFVGIGALIGSGTPVWGPAP